ncbi:MAG: RnfH family protein [Candidatus Thiodiazotropha sp.]|nr:RnfH family protein [Candidatus Thiodiazotropha taylori]MBT3059277.1 RnfH family protein [Candidatus Thiodiazotropha sp. (ex Lucina pensylvanica)]MBV2095488.1 RnfH family protein [Candidatus Thiodiazotropha sp. (ex Codakia orbicularis)]PUB75897.1 MAG: RnfH family protein [gamma proteobacterium symbiont of Ctena orbiculata]MBT3063258.1 RnfH family protein [Candidatus Thiodiazotropha sp. (ex Lucina pensylvanica)]
MNVGVAYADKFKQVWLKLEVPDESTVRQAIEHSGLLEQFPEIDLENQKVGIFGKLTKLDAKLEEGSRVEIYRTITADPDLVERRDRDNDD